jgi:hypothetical protein
MFLWISHLTHPCSVYRPFHNTDLLIENSLFSIIFFKIACLRCYQGQKQFLPNNITSRAKLDPLFARGVQCSGLQLDPQLIWCPRHKASAHVTPSRDTSFAVCIRPGGSAFTNQHETYISAWFGPCFKKSRAIFDERLKRVFQHTRCSNTPCSHNESKLQMT